MWSFCLQKSIQRHSICMESLISFSLHTQTPLSNVNILFSLSNSLFVKKVAKFSFSLALSVVNVCSTYLRNITTYGSVINNVNFQVSLFLSHSHTHNLREFIILV